MKTMLRKSEIPGHYRWCDGGKTWTFPLLEEACEDLEATIKVVAPSYTWSGETQQRISVRSKYGTDLVTATLLPEPMSRNSLRALDITLCLGVFALIFWNL
jgi:hypothetical protein